jgi:hypothetical protein
VYSNTNGPSKECLPQTNYVMNIKLKVDENADNSENTEETLEDEVNENDIKTSAIILFAFLSLPKLKLNLNFHKFDL